MKNRILCWAAGIVVLLVLIIGTGTVAQTPKLPRHLSGLINDYSPETGGGPWEMRGVWSLTIKRDGKADFSAALNMVHSDYWIVLNPSAVNDDTALTGRNPHTHHITLSDQDVQQDTSGCAGIFVSGPATVTANGSAAPFASMGPSTLQVCVTGGTEVDYSNVTLTFIGPATGHFGTQAIHGVVRKPGAKDDFADFKGHDSMP